MKKFYLIIGVCEKAGHENISITFMQIHSLFELFELICIIRATHMPKNTIDYRQVLKEKKSFLALMAWDGLHLLGRLDI